MPSRHARAQSRPALGAAPGRQQKLSGAVRGNNTPSAAPDKALKVAMEYYYAIVATVSGLSMLLYWNTLVADFAYDDR
ncbi:hypothetical protein JTE90_004873 [Oedothorax gibbosus]|uniref:Uncharacterized protein n=1 Tax=Oedothorax gibbosus TaxID=931172 RepID=A0AAV6UTK6_9ARAC|nr:hypothetical protein JTE90_004873 [Oedothorax gibbosus]